MGEDLVDNGLVLDQGEQPHLAAAVRTAESERMISHTGKMRQYTRTPGLGSRAVAASAVFALAVRLCCLLGLMVGKMSTDVGRGRAESRAGRTGR